MKNQLDSILVRPAMAGVLLICAPGATAQNAYVQTNLVANRAEFAPQIVDPLLANPWGIALRPPGAGGHIWTSNAASGTTTTYVGDVPGLPLYQDELKVVEIPKSQLYDNLDEWVSQPTGQVYNGSASDFWISDGSVEGSARFIFVALDGNITAWTTGMSKAVTVVDDSLSGSMYSGIAVETKDSGNRIYVCNFGLERLDIFDHEFKRITVDGDFKDPNVPLTFSHYNIQYMDGRLFVAWARIGDDPGEEDNYPGYGYLSEFDTEGHLLKSYEHVREIDSPWGLAIAPANFGALSNTLLVANFGDGTTIAFDRETGEFVDYLRGTDGEPIAVDGIWGLTFGNGVRLGYANHLYFTAGPNVEVDGILGKFAPPWVTGDLNCDGSVDFADIDGFAAALIGNATYAEQYPWCAAYLADSNGDGQVDFNDIDGFVALLNP